MPLGTAGGAIPPGEAVRELVRRVEQGEDPRGVLQRALEVYQGPNDLPPNTVIGAMDREDFATTAGSEAATYRTPHEAYHRYMSEIRRHPTTGKYREYFMPVVDWQNDSFGEGRR